jgi:hypothetical protein
MGKWVSRCIYLVVGLYYPLLMVLWPNNRLSKYQR